jgi:hypothetical protein
MLTVPSHGHGFYCGPAIATGSCDRNHTYTDLPIRRPFGAAYVVTIGNGLVVGACTNLPDALHSAAEYVTAQGVRYPTAHVVVRTFVGTRDMGDDWHIYGA